jgi:hypothetical protein
MTRLSVSNFKTSSSRTVLALMLAAGLAALPPAAEAGQTIDIETDVTHVVYGNGDAADNGSGDPFELGDANGNTLTIGSGAVVKNYVYGGLNYDGDASNNHVIVNPGSATFPVHGGFSFFGSTDNNSVTITDGPGSWWGYGGSSYDGAASGNSVTILDCVVG